MGSKIITIPVYGMYCGGCEAIIEASLRKLPGVVAARASIEAGNVEVEYDKSTLQENDITKAIEDAGYSIRGDDWKKYAVFALVASAMVALAFSKPGNMLVYLLEYPKPTYGLIFSVGLVTGLHCVGMCGGLMLSSMPTGAPGAIAASLTTTLLYNTGRVISYTATGVLLGKLGSVVVVSDGTRVVVMVASAVLMIVMGMNMAGANFFHGLMLHVPLTWRRRLSIQGPLTLGLLTGLFPCAPLQMMQMMALNSRGALTGGLVMFVFAAGTIPALLPIGLLSGVWKSGRAKRVMQLNGALIILLGIILAYRGLAII